MEMVITQLHPINFPLIEIDPSVRAKYQWCNANKVESANLSYGGELSLETMPYIRETEFFKKNGGMFMLKHNVFSWGTITTSCHGSKHIRRNVSLILTGMFNGIKLQFYSGNSYVIPSHTYIKDDLEEDNTPQKMHRDIQERWEDDILRLFLKNNLRTR